MTPAQWAEVKQHFHDALEQPAGTEPTYLGRVCSSEIVLAEVERLLVEHRLAGSFLNRPAFVPEGERTVDYSGTPRFDVQQKIGSGTFGAVYRVFDHARNSVVALKRLLHLEPAHLLRFKREFRSLVDLVDPNLVQLYELFGDDRQWFFTMELVQGVDFLSYVRPGNIPGDADRLRDGLFQLATGVRALHSSSLLHRDLKPSNVLVTEDGRVVILDFGLVRESDPQAIEQSFTFAGSPAYMAPEQSADGGTSEAADWYAVGVMLFQALSGQLPFGGTATETLEDKRLRAAPRCRDLVPDVPDDLDEACRQLLDRDPEARAGAAAILLAYGRKKLFVTDRMPGIFVGRHQELDLLHERFDALCTGLRQVVLVQGQSGIGKTSLLARFLGEVQRKRPAAVILRGQCRASEVVPYNALDSVADALVRHLRGLPEPVRRALLPRHPQLLRRLFPVFGELDSLNPAHTPSVAPFDEQQVRHRAFEALSELLGRMTDRSPVVIWIDDLQWSDLDSIAFLTELVIPSGAPTLMLLLSFRSEEASTSPALVALKKMGQPLQAEDSWVEIEVHGLSDAERHELLDHLDAQSPGGRPSAGADSGAIVNESGGSPLLLGELHRFASLQNGTAEKAGLGQGVLISEMIRHRAGMLSSTARELLEAMSVAGEPLSIATVCGAVQTHDSDPAREIHRLVQDHLVRVTGNHPSATLEPFHDQVREAAVAWLTASQLRDWHKQLAWMFERDACRDPQRLLRHYRGAATCPLLSKPPSPRPIRRSGRWPSNKRLDFYAESLETGQADESAQATLHRKRAQALAKAGRGYESAASYLKAAGSSATDDPLEMRRLAAGQLLRAGHLDEGTQIFYDLLASVGVRIPARRIETLLRMLAIRAFIRVRTLRFHERAEAEVDAGKLRKLDLLWSGAMSLISIDTITGSYLQALHMLAALRAGEPSRLAMSTSFAAIYESMGGTRDYEHGRKLINLARHLATRLNDEYLLAMTYGCWSALDMLAGRVKDGLVHCQTAISRLNDSGRRGITWELGTFKMLLIWFLGWSGRLRELSEQLP